MEKTTLVITQLLTLSVLLYAAIDVLGQVVDRALPKKYTYFIKKIGAIGLGIYLCLYFKADITFLIRAEYDAIGAILAGIIISQGTGYVKDIFKQLNQSANDANDIAKDITDTFKKLSKDERISTVNELITIQIEDKELLKHPVPQLDIDISGQING